MKIKINSQSATKMDLTYRNLEPEEKTEENPEEFFAVDELSGEKEEGSSRLTLTISKPASIVDLAKPDPSVSKDDFGVVTSDNMLADNFVHQQRDESRYIKGMLQGYKVQNQFRDNLQNIVVSNRILAQMGDPESYAEKNEVGKKAAKEAEEYVKREYTEEQTEKLEEERKETEKAEEEKNKPDSEKSVDEVAEEKIDEQQKVTSEAEEAMKSVGEQEAVQAVAHGDETTVTATVESTGSDAEVDSQSLDSEEQTAVTPKGAHVDEYV